MKRNDPMLVPPPSADGAEAITRRPEERTAVPAGPAPVPLEVPVERPPVLAPAPTGEITITQYTQIAPAQPDRPPASGEKSPPGTRGVSRHTLVLIGDLDRGSSHTLEAAIERLCEAGIAAITLDLTKLSGIDSVGVAVIAFRSSWCRKRGHELTLTPAPRAVQRAFELAGVAQSLTFTDGEAAGAEM